MNAGDQRDRQQLELTQRFDGVTYPASPCFGTVAEQPDIGSCAEVAQAAFQQDSSLATPTASRRAYSSAPIGMGPIRLYGR